MYYRVLLALMLAVSKPAIAFDDLYRLNWLEPSDPVASTTIFPELVNSIYKTQDFRLVWHQPEASQELESLLQILHYAQLSPLFSARLAQLIRLRETGQWYLYDIVATDTILNFKLYTRLVEHNGFDWFYGHRIELPRVLPDSATIEQFNKSAATSDLVNYVKSLYGTPDQMESVHSAIARLQLAMEQGVGPYYQAGLLKFGDAIYDKKALVDRLDVVGVDVSQVNLDAGFYDVSLKKPIQAFQRMHGLKADGVIGKQTLYWLNMPLEQRLHSIALNTERSRLMPSNRHNVIIVNLPSFHLYYWHEGRPEFTAKVIVGKKKRKTPLMKIRMDTLIMNPSWNVPRKLVREDIIPQIKKDFGYLERMNIKILKSWSSREEIDPTTINWETVNPATFAYNMTQAPGKRNALGEYKFNTPNARAIYLHDTPSKYLFNKTSRAYSSGCIRVQYADKFAKTLMDIQGIEPPLQSPDEPVSQKVPLRKQIPVHILYQTAWIKDGLVHYRKDIYGYDETTSPLSLTKN